MRCPRTVLFDLQPASEPITLNKKFPRQPFPPIQAVATVVAPGVSDGAIEAHHFVHQVAEKLGLSGHFGQQSANLCAQHRQQGGDKGRHGIDVHRVEGQICCTEVPQEYRLHMIADESAIVVQKRGNVRKKVLGPINAVCGPVTFKVVAKAHLQRLHEHVEREKHWRKLDLVARPAGVVHALQLGHLQVEQVDDGRLPLLPQRGGDVCFGRGPVDLLEDALEMGGKGMVNVCAQALGDAADVVEQLGRGSLGVVLQVDEAGVQGAQLLVWLEGGLAGSMELRLGLFAAQTSADGGLGVHGIAVLPQAVDLAEQLHVSARDMEPVQLVERRLKARDRLFGRLAGGDDEQPLVDVGLLAAEGVRLALQLCVVRLRVLLRVVEVFLCGVDLLLQHALLLCDAGEKRL